MFKGGLFSGSQWGLRSTDGPEVAFYIHDSGVCVVDVWSSCTDIIFISILALDQT